MIKNAQSSGHASMPSSFIRGYTFAISMVVVHSSGTQNLNDKSHLQNGQIAMVGWTDQ